MSTATTPAMTRVGVALAVVAATVLAGCSGGAPVDTGRTTITVSHDPGLSQGALDAFNARVSAFEAANPTIDVTQQEYKWEATTFTAQLAGRTLPDVFTVPFTDGRGLIERKQVADVSGLVAALPYAGKFSPTVANAGEAADGTMWAVPISAYGQALHYNRTLFAQAGLDPNTPPATWDEVRADARQIAQKTGQTGFGQLTSDNTGGWILTTLDYALGGRVEQAAGDKVTATIDTPQMRNALGMLHSMRWDDNSMGANFLYDWNGINQAFAAGQIGMYVSGGGNYTDLLAQNAIRPADYGVTVLPLSGADAGVLGGGALAVVSAAASDPVKAAAVKWIDFYYMGKLTTETGAVDYAKANAAAGEAVGSPELPVFDRATFDQREKWIAPFVNVPIDQMAPYTSKVFDQPLVPEPARSTQAVYALLDPVVQRVLTDRDADIPGLLAAAQTQAQALLDRG